MPDAEQTRKLDALYPVGDRQPERVRTRHGRRLADLTLDNLLAGSVTGSDFGITGEALRLQAEIAEQAGRPNLAQNLRRGAEIATVPDDVLLEIYELLRPGRAHSADALRESADDLRRTYGAEETARLIDEAATVYERRDIFRRRF